MKGKFQGYHAVYPGWDPEDRFTALEEVKTLLKSRLVNVDCMLEVLFKSNSATIDFNIGDIAIQFVRGFGVWSERKDVIQMTVELPKNDGFGDVVGYEYTLNELKPTLMKPRQFNIQEENE
jgi:hypothetical protein